MNRHDIEALSTAERAQLEALLQGGTLGARTMKRAQILLMADGLAHTDEQIAAALPTSTSTIFRTRRRLVEGGVDHALSEKRRPGAKRLLNACQEATLVALACSTPPPGRCRWTLQLLAEHLVLMCDDLPAVSSDTVGRRLKEKKIKPWLKKMWCLRKINAEFIARMEDILELYAEAPDPRFPVVCFDESLKQLIDEVKAPRPVLPGHPAQQDYHYQRNGTAKILFFIDAHRPWREVMVTENRTRAEFALAMKKLVDDFYPDADKIRVVLDNLNTHNAASLYTTFPAAEARRIARRIEFHYTPKHASWLNMVEIEIGSLARQCLDRRIGDLHTLQREVAAWVKTRNSQGATINWLFDVKAARKKMARHYPKPSINQSKPLR